MTTIAPLEEHVRALRTTVALVHHPVGARVLVEGRDAFDVVDALLSTDLFLRDGQLREALVLDEEGDVELDVVVGRDGESMLLLVEGGDAAHVARLVAAVAAGRDARAVDLGTTHEVVELHGPYAWELLGVWLGPDLVGLPHLAFERAGEVLVARAGKTGEYGYHVLLPRHRSAALRAALAGHAPRFAATAVGPSTLALARLENGFLDLPALAPRARDPLELQLGWRLAHGKSYRGSDALARRRSLGPRRRVTWIRAPRALAAGDAVAAEHEVVGEVVHAAWDPVTASSVGLAMLPRSVACAGIEGLEAVAPSGSRCPLRTVSPPLLLNRSLFVSPQRHAFDMRAERVLPEPWR